MRALPLIPALLIASACWTPGPGQVDPTRYPWDQRKLAGTYCVVSLKTPPATGNTGIVARGNVPALEEARPGGLKTMELACKEPHAR